MKSKIFTKYNSDNPVHVQERLRTILRNKYYNIYLNNFDFEGEIDYQQKEYVLKRFWCDGRIACFKIGEAVNKQHPQGLAVFCPFAPGYWNIYDYPVKVNLINTRGVKFIPVGLQEVDKDVVIGYAQRNKKPIVAIVDSYIDRMVEVLMTINTNLTAHKMPWLVVGAEEEQTKLSTLLDKVKNNDPELFIDAFDTDKLKVLLTGAPYIIDKLYNYYCAIENELREFLGFQNIGVSEKKEHLIGEEVRANNALVEANKDCILDSMKEFFERIRDVLGIEIRVSVKKNNEPTYEDEDTQEEQEVQQDE